MLSLPRLVGVDPDSGEDILAQNGRYGPYLTRGKDSRSLVGEEDIFTCTLEQALALFAQPKMRRGRGQAAGPLKVVGTDPSTGKEVTVREGRFGTYITDGETNASLRGGDTVETISIERASDLLAERRAAGPSPKKAAGKRAASGSSAPRKSTRKSSTGKPANGTVRTVTKRKPAAKSGVGKPAASSEN
jgi:DNA topoisomerase-1